MFEKECFSSASTNYDENIFFSHDFFYVPPNCRKSEELLIKFYESLKVCGESLDPYLEFMLHDPEHNILYFI